jgi:hypothetical protein
MVMGHFGWFSTRSADSLSYRSVRRDTLNFETRGGEQHFPYDIEALHIGGINKFRTKLVRAIRQLV